MQAMKEYGSCTGNEGSKVIYLCCAVPCSLTEVYGDVSSPIITKASYSQCVICIFLVL